MSKRKAPKRTKPTVVEVDSEDDFSQSPAEKSRIRKRNLERRLTTICPILKNKDLFDSQRSTTPESTSADCSSPSPTPSKRPILITSSSEEEEVLPPTPPERITELERRKKMMDLGEEAIRMSDFASGQVFRCPRVVSTSDEEESVSGGASTIDTDQTLSDDHLSTTKAAYSDSDEEIMIVRRKKKRE
eukprot:sb/3471279/